MNGKRQHLYMGELVRLVGVSVKTVRHYHKLGLLPEPESPDIDDVTLRRLAKSPVEKHHVVFDQWLLAGNNNTSLPGFQLSGYAYQRISDDRNDS